MSNNENNNIEIKDFLGYFPYQVMHEKSKKFPRFEHFFCVIQDEHLKNPIVKQYIIEYTKKYPLLDLSEKSMEYMIEHKGVLHFVSIDSLDTKDNFYLHNKALVEDNANNILSMRMINEPADLAKHLSTKWDNYFSQFKELSMGAGLIAKDVLADKIQKGKTLYEEKSPEIHRKANEIKSSLANKFNAFKKKF